MNLKDVEHVVIREKQKEILVLKIRNNQIKTKRIKNKKIISKGEAKKCLSFIMREKHIYK